MTTGQDRLNWRDRCRRWGQVNLWEIDPLSVDLDWWADIFRRTRIDGLTINGAGIVAYYPSTIPGLRRSSWLAERDLLGEFVTAARRLELNVLARTDIGGVHHDFYSSHPDWAAIDAAGRPFRYHDVDLYHTCPSGPYYWDFFPKVLREMLTRYDIDGFFDNGWASIGRREGICHCVHCGRRFHEATGHELPDREDWDSPIYRAWVDWRYTLYEAVWDHLQRQTSAVKPSAVWLGILWEQDFDWLALARKGGLSVVENQGRTLHTPSFAVGEMGKRIRPLADRLPVFHLTGTWYMHTPWKRQSAKPAAEQTLWLAEGVASGMRPWWHSVGATNEDRRWVEPVEAFFQWHARHDTYLVDRESTAMVGLVFSVQTLDFYGRQDQEQRVLKHRYGMYQALLRARIPFDVVHERRLDPASLAQYRVLVLANVASLSDVQCRQIRDFADRGGAVVATFETSLYDEWGQRRADYGLATVLGVHYAGPPIGPLGHAFQLLRRPEHPILAWVKQTDFLAMNGHLCQVAAETSLECLATLIPACPTYPPEMTWPPVRETTTPTVLAGDWGTWRSVYFPSDIDREVWSHNFPDFQRLLGEAVRWALAEAVHVDVRGPGLLDIQPYRKGDDVIVHLVNLNQVGLWKAPIDELVPLPRQTVRVWLPAERRARSAELLVAECEVPLTRGDGWAEVGVPEILAHEVVVIHL